MFDIRNYNTINKLKAALKDADNENRNLKSAMVLADIQKSKVLKPVRSVINNIENANIPFFTTNNSNINDSISKTSAGFPRIESAMSVKVPFYTGSKINEPENQIDVNSINNILKRNSEILNNSVINNVEPLVNLNQNLIKIQKI